MNLFPQKLHLLKEQYRWKKKSQLLYTAFQSYPMILFISLLIAAGCMLYLWQWTHYLQAGYQLQTLETEKKTLEYQLHLLEVERNFLTRPQRLDAIATKYMKLDLPKATQNTLLSPVIANQ